MIDPTNNIPIVVLKDVDGNSVLPIWVGMPEANAIALEIAKESTARPMTHDLIRNLLFGLDAGVKKVVVCDLKEDTYYAVIWVEREGKLIAVDSRPSDALAIALRLDCPIYVEESVLKTSRAASLSEPGSTDELRRWLEGLKDDDLGQYKM
jgi:bifunctional DNase/RNase